MRVHHIGLFFFAGALFAAPDADSLPQKLRALEAQLDQHKNGEVLSTLPASWPASAGGREYTISTEPLRKLLQSSASPETAADDAKIWLEHLANHLEQGSAPSAAAANAPDALKRVLKRPEFAGLAGPTAWDRFREQMAAKIGEYFARLFNAIAEYPEGSRIFFWTLLTAAVLALAWWLLRRWSRDERLSLNIPPAAVSRSSDEWIAAAKAAAESGDFRTAIQCAYWGAVAGLEARGTLAHNLAHTPRETLRAASRRGSGAVSAFTVPLAILTDRLERCWYAGMPAGAADFDACRAALESLGYRWD